MVSLFSLRNTSLKLGSTRILEDFSIEIPDYATTVITGPSGSGKSSVLRLLNRLEAPQSGTVSFRGTDIGTLDVNRLRRQVGMVFQSPAVFAGTVADNVRVAQPGLSVTEVAEALQRVGLDPHLADQNADRLSGGEAQRMCLARSLLVDPDVLLLDEPTSALDHESVSVVEDLLVRLAREGLPQVWVSHDLDQVERIASHVIEMPPRGTPDE